MRPSRRSGRTAYGGLRPTDASLTSMVLIALNVAVWIAVVATGGAGSRLLDWLVLRTQGLCLAGGRGFDVSQSVCEGNGGTWMPGVVDGVNLGVEGNALVQVRVGGVRILARVTRDTVERLRLGPGTALFALVKAAGIERPHPEIV